MYCRGDVLKWVLLLHTRNIKKMWHCLEVTLKCHSLCLGFYVGTSFLNVSICNDLQLHHYHIQGLGLSLGTEHCTGYSPQTWKVGISRSILKGYHTYRIYCSKQSYRSSTSHGCILGSDSSLLHPDTNKLR